MSEIDKPVSTCRLCESTAIEKAIGLRPVSVRTANVGYLEAKDGTRLAKTEAALDVYLCTACGNAQLGTVVDPEILYSDFRYKTAVSVGLDEHFRGLAHKCREFLKKDDFGLVVEIGSNDGTLLKHFKTLGHAVFGIDPAQSAAADAEADGIPTMVDFFTADLGKKIREVNGPASVVTCNYTFANIDDLDDVMDGISCLLSDDGVLAIETSYIKAVLEGMHVDTINHEHLSYFAVTPLNIFLKKHGLEIVDVELIPTKGGSIRVIAARSQAGIAVRPSVVAIEQDEKAFALETMAPYSSFQAQLESSRKEILNAVDRLIRDGRKVVGFGAAVGSTIMVQQFDLAHKLPVIFDDNPIQDILEGPDYAIPVSNASHMGEENPDGIVVLAWRYADQIIAHHKANVKSDAVFMIPLPNVRFA